MMDEQVQEDNMVDAKYRSKVITILGLLPLIIPWTIKTGTTEISRRIISNVDTSLIGEYRTTIVQFLFFRYEHVSGRSISEGQFTFLSSNGDPFSSLIFGLAVLYYLVGISVLIQNTIKQESISSMVGANFFISALIFLFYNVLAIRDTHALVYNTLGINWAASVDGSSFPWVFPIVFFILGTIGVLEAIRLKYYWIASIGNMFRYSVIILFCIISVFPLIWVFIVSINTQTVIRSGQPLFPLDPSKPVSFDSYNRFFLFEGNMQLSGIYLVISTIFLLIAYKMITNTGVWLDRVQAFLYKRSKRLGSNQNSTIAFWLLLILSVTLFFFFLSLIILPNFWLIEGGAFRWNLQLAPQAGGQVYPVGNWFLITTVICAGVSLFGLIMSSLSAYALSRFDFPAKGGFIAIVLGTQMFPGIILLLPLLVMWRQLGLYGSIFGLTVAYATFAVPFATFFLKSYYDSIPQDLEEAAMVDGSSRLGAFTRVILPLSLPGLSSAFLFSFLTGYTEYLLALTLYNPEAEKYTISLALINVFRVDFQNYYFPDLALFSIIVAAPILLMFVYIQRFLIAGLASGGIKG